VDGAIERKGWATSLLFTRQNVPFKNATLIRSRRSARRLRSCGRAGTKAVILAPGRKSSRSGAKQKLAERGFGSGVSMPCTSAFDRQRDVQGRGLSDLPKIAVEAVSATMAQVCRLEGTVVGIDRYGECARTKLFEYLALPSRRW